MRLAPAPQGIVNVTLNNKKNKNSCKLFKKMYHCVNVKSVMNKQCKKTIAEMIGNSRGIVNAYVSPVEDHILHKPSPLHCTSTNNKPCRLIVKHIYRVMKSFGVLCHHPLVKGHIKPGGKNIWKDAETTG